MRRCIALIRLLIGLAPALSLSAYARADVVAVVSATSPIQALSRGELTDIFLGRQVRFSDGLRAVPLDQEVGSQARDEFYTSLVGISAAQLKAHWSKIVFTGRGKPPRALPNGLELRKALEANPQAVGYIDRSLVDDSVRVLNIQPLRARQSP